MKKLLMNFYYGWDSVMNLKYNPIRFIGDMSIQMYTMTVLSIFWSMAFCAFIAGWQGIIPLLYGHVGILGMIFATYATFKQGNDRQEEWFKRWETELAQSNIDRTKNACKWDLEKEA